VENLIGKSVTRLSASPVPPRKCWSYILIYFSTASLQLGLLFVVLKLLTGMREERDAYRTLVGKI
jgi:hypothetical protein